VYWSDLDGHSISRAHINGTNQEVLIYDKNECMEQALLILFELIVLQILVLKKFFIRLGLLVLTSFSTNICSEYSMRINYY